MKRLRSLLLCAVVMSAPLFAQRGNESLQYQFPRSSAELVTRHASVILRPGPMLDPASVSDPSLFSVAGSRSGVHAGRVVLSDDGRTVLFLPTVPFAPGERVSVEIRGAIRTVDGESFRPRPFTFTIDATPDAVRAAARPRPEFEPADLPPGSEAAAALPLPDDFPMLTVTTVDRPAPGRIYLSNLTFGTATTTPYLMILDNSGIPVFKEKKGLPCYDFKRQPDGTLTYFDDSFGCFVIMDSTYRQIGVMNPGHGYKPDVHELLVLPNGHFLIMGFDPHTVDMSTVVTGGKKDAVLLDIVIQELDAARNVVFEWRSVDHFLPTDAIHENLTLAEIDHVHPNSLEVDTDGNILMSSRHLDEVTKISRSTGEIIWRLGGKHNQFTFVNDPDNGFFYQHDARRLANGNLMLYDNGNFHSPQHSRAVEYTLDETARTATMAWQYRHTPEIFSRAMGNAQRLPNGNTMIGWGAYPMVTEVRPDGTIAFEMKLPQGVFSYRAFRLPAATSLVWTELMSPENGQASVPKTVNLTWDRTGGASSYHLQIATDAAFTTIVHEETSLPVSSATVGPLAERTEYWWRVRALGEEIDGQWSETWSFVTEGPDLSQLLIAPPQGARDLPMSPVLHWEKFPDARSYNVQVSFADLFFTAPMIDTVMRGTYLWLGELEQGGRYYWRVRPELTGGSGNWSQIWNFETSLDMFTTLPQRIIPRFPADQAALDRANIRFVWEPGGNSAYRLEVAADPIFAAIVFDSTLTDTTVMVSESLLPPSLYWWRVRATSEYGEQYGSPIFIFRMRTAAGVDDANDPAAVTGSLFPNPATGAATVRLSLARTSEVAVRLTDVHGRQVAAPFTGTVEAGDHAIALPLDGVPNGVYLCAVSTADGTFVRRLVVAR